ncbi:MAG: pyridoxamine 5'-phosphate oxidase family protein [Archangium sp.]
MNRHALDPNAVITDEAALRALIGEPAELVKKKVASSLNALTRQFIERAPFLCLSTSDSQGRCDVSPRGDPPGFVRILDDTTLLIPERPGNRLADSLRNILSNPRVGVLFVIPGVGETLRVNGRATLTTDSTLLEPCAVEGRPPKLGIYVEIEEAFTQCPKAFIRSELWNAVKFSERSSLPSLGEILSLQCGAEVDAKKYDAERAARYARREGFY